MNPSVSLQLVSMCFAAIVLADDMPAVNGGAGTANATTPNERSILSMGNGSRLERVFAKARRGESITVGAIGGSITQGASVSSNYLSRVTQWWRSGFPDTEVKSVNAGIGGTGSNYGSLRVRRDLLSHKPDFVIVEYAVNDRNTKDAAETLEGVVRQIMNQPNQPAVILLFMVTKTGESAQEWFSKVGFHYGLPMVSYRDAVWPELAAGRMQWSDISPDKVHPNDHGHSLAAGWITGLLERVLDKSPADPLPPVPALPQPLFTDLYEFTSLQEAADLKPLANDGWKLLPGAKGGWTASDPGAHIEFEMDGRVLFAGYRLANGPMGKVRVTVDGKDAGIIDGWFAPKTHSPRKTVKIAKGLGPGPHRVRFELLPDRHPGSTGNTFQILGLGAALGMPARGNP